jgi:hypothetical protein
MRQKRLSELMVDFIHWRARYVGTRPRQVEIEQIAQANPRWTVMASAINLFLERVRRGDDLTPHLSLSPNTRGYSLAARTLGATTEDRWSDKDRLLNQMNYHHFHLGTSIEAAGHAARTDDLLFAEVSRDTFKVAAIFSHEVFDTNSEERRRLTKLHNWIIARGLPPGGGYMTTPLMSSGHSMHVVMYADRCSKLIRTLDPQLDDRAYVETLYSHTEMEMPAKPKFEWRFDHLDLVICDVAKGVGFNVQQAWN